MIPLALWLTLMLAPPSPEATYDAIERMIDRGETAEASAALADATLGEGARQRLLGLLALAQGRFAAAASAFQAALVETPDDAMLRVYTARAQLAAGDAEAAEVALRGSETLSARVLAQPLIAAAVQRARGDLDGAYATLHTAAAAFPKHPAPTLELVALCAQTQLSAAASAWAQELVARGPDRTATLAAMRLLHRDAGARPVLEQLAARFVDDAEVRAHLAHGYAATDAPGVAARLFDEATALGGDYAFEAADQHRVAGRTDSALLSNARVADAVRRLQQRVEILFAAGRHSRLIALADALADAGAMTSDVRLRLAYAHHALGHYARATALSRALLDTNRARRARALLRAMGHQAPP